MVTRRITSNPTTVNGTAATDQRYESTLEQDYFVLLRFDPWVESFLAHPFKIQWVDPSGKRHDYTPDVLVHFRKDVAVELRRHPLLVEIKPDLDEEGWTIRKRHSKLRPRKENMEENRMKWAAAQAYAQEREWEFQVVHESDIRTPYLKNARFLLGFLEREIRPHREGSLLDHLQKYGPMAGSALLDSLSNGIEERATVLPTFYRLVAQRRIHTDLSLPFTLDSLVSLPSHG